MISCLINVYQENVFFPSVIRLWNALPPFVINSLTLDDFCTNLHNHYDHACAPQSFWFLHSNKYNNNNNHETDKFDGLKEQLQLRKFYFPFRTLPVECKDEVRIEHTNKGTKDPSMKVPDVIQW